MCPANLFPKQTMSENKTFYWKQPFFPPVDLIESFSFLHTSTDMLFTPLTFHLKQSPFSEVAAFLDQRETNC